MYETVNWLIGVESTASALYAAAAVVFREDKGFSKFLSTLSLEEKEHERLLSKASLSISDAQMKKASFYIDAEFRDKVEAPFSRAWGLLRQGALTKESMIDVVAEAEFSEWNELFLYAIDCLNATGGEFQEAVSEIDRHRVHVQEYIASLPDGESFIQRVKKLSRVARKRLLIVEENNSVARMLEALAMDEVEVVLARNGEEGLAHIQRGHFDLIVSDIEMTAMNGVDLYKRAIETDPSIANRFIFFTATENPEHLDFVRAANVLLIAKPSPVKVICEMMNDVLALTTHNNGATLH